MKNSSRVEPLYQQKILLYFQLSHPSKNNVPTKMYTYLCTKCGRNVDIIEYKKEWESI